MCQILAKLAEERPHRVTQDNLLTMLPGLDLVFNIDSLFLARARPFCKRLEQFVFWGPMIRVGGYLAQFYVKTLRNGKKRT